jgi:prevent-host-death family protein
MVRIKLDKDIMPISEFRANATSLIEQVNRTKRPLVITQHGKSSAILLDVSEYENLIETVELLKDIVHGQDDVINNRVYTTDQVREMLLKKKKKNPK